MIQSNSHVTLHYSLALEDGQVVLSTFGERPATLQLGMGQFSEGLERCLMALSEGEERFYRLGPDDAFGPRNPELIQRLSRKLMQAHSDSADPLEPGDLIEFPGPDGARLAGVFKGWEGAEAIFDFNHPLAGVPLDFRVQIIGVL